jgi:cytochrome P450
MKTSATLHYLLYELSRRGDLQEELYQEIVSAYPNDGIINEEALTKIPLLKAMLKETLRFHSVAPTTSRVLSQDLVLDNHLIPKDTLVHVVLTVISKSERYFKNANVFDTKRWLRENQKIEPIDPFATLPFGFGIRMCVGRRLAEQKIYIILMKV